MQTTDQKSRKILTVSCDFKQISTNSTTVLLFFRKRLSCSESFTESDTSPSSGVRRRFSALMDTHRLASPLEVDSELQIHSKQPQVKARGVSLEGALGAIPSTADLKPFIKDCNGFTAGTH